MKWEKIQKYVPIIGFVVVVLLFAFLTGGKILAIKNLKMIAEQSILLVVGGIGVIFVMSTGGVDFSQGSIMGICCVVGTLLSYTSIPLASGATKGNKSLYNSFPAIFTEICSILPSSAFLLFYAVTS